MPGCSIRDTQRLRTPRHPRMHCRPPRHRGDTYRPLPHWSFPRTLEPLDSTVLTERPSSQGPAPRLNPCTPP